MVSNKCIVSGCINAAKRKYVFPINDQDFVVWVERAKNPKLNSLSKSQIRKTYQICANHFDPVCFSPGTNNKLKYRSLPTLHLPRNIVCSMFVCMLVCSACNFVFSCGKNWILKLKFVLTFI